MSHLQTLKRVTGKEKIPCYFCGKPAYAAHHRRYRSRGGSDEPSNLEPVCFHCHMRKHAQNGDWARWGQRGGQETAKDPMNWFYNLRPFRIMKEEAFELWQEWHRYYREGKQGEKPLTLKEYKAALAAV